jgi:hypothetical protein
MATVFSGQNILRSLSMAKAYTQQNKSHLMRQGYRGTSTNQWYQPCEARCACFLPLTCSSSCFRSRCNRWLSSLCTASLLSAAATRSSTCAPGRHSHRCTGRTDEELPHEQLLHLQVTTPACTTGCMGVGPVLVSLLCWMPSPWCCCPPHPFASSPPSAYQDSDPSVRLLCCQLLCQLLTQPDSRWSRAGAEATWSRAGPAATACLVCEGHAS